MYYAMGGAFRIIGGDDAGLYFRHTDHLGSTSVLSDSDGYKIEGSEVVYAPFGEIREGEQSNLTDFGFTGQRLDSSTGGLMFYQSRYYLPGLKRFISPDTIVPGSVNPQAFNRYSYTLNNPLNFIDPTGHVAKYMSKSGIDEFIEQSGVSDDWWPVSQSAPSGPVSDYLPSDWGGWDDGGDDDDDGCGVCGFGYYSEAEDYPPQRVIEYQFSVQIKSPTHSDSWQSFGGSNTLGGSGYHPGVDSQSEYGVENGYVNRAGNPIYAAAPGEVVEVHTMKDRGGNAIGCGSYVVVKHTLWAGTPAETSYYSIYAHLDEQSVDVGDVVDNDT